MTHWKRLLVLGLLVPSIAAAQEPTTPAPTASLQPAPTAGLSLADAFSTALAKNPDYQQWLNNESPASLAVKSSYWTLLPSASVSGGFNYTGSGSSNFGGTNVVKTSASVGSSYSIDLGWTLDGRVLNAPGQSKANLRATQEQIAAARVSLRAAVQTQYLTVLQTNARINVIVQQVGRNKVFLDLAKARYQVGQATMLDVRQAEVTLGQSEVDLLVAHQQNADARLELFRLMGVSAPEGFEQVTLTDSFPVVEPAYSLDDLLATAAQVNPNLLAAEASSEATSYNLKSVKSEYFPTLRAGATWAGYTQEYTDENSLLDQAYGSASATAANCSFQNDVIRGLTYGPGGIPGYPNGGIIPDCNVYSGLNPSGTALNPVVSQQIIDANNVFPWNFTTQPFQVFAGLSLPIFNGLQRETRVSEAKARRDDATEQARAQALAVRTQVTSRYLAIDATYKAIAVAEANRIAAADQLRLAQDRYRLGQGTALELSDSEGAVQRAEGTYVDAVYAYHKAVAALEEAVGQPLRQS
ncbi:MAG TPA: TolC family protein [Gemmatimonadales bacterium]|nr:TolC family protein [Gemmatimonadales bacterium]